MTLIDADFEPGEDFVRHFLVAFIASPRDAAEMTDLHAVTLDLVTEMEHDLRTPLDWIAVDHWNGEHPHIHIIPARQTDKDSDLARRPKWFQICTPR